MTKIGGFPVESDYIEERPGGPALVGTRVGVEDILVYLTDPIMTEARLAELLGLKPGQIAAARAYILDNPDTVFVRHAELASRLDLENPPDLVERLKRRHESLMNFKAWLATREAESGTGRFPSFREWLAERESRSKIGS